MTLLDAREIANHHATAYADLRDTYDRLKPGPERDRIRAFMLEVAQDYSKALGWARRLEWAQANYEVIQNC